MNLNNTSKYWNRIWLENQLQGRDEKDHFYWLNLLSGDIILQFLPIIVWPKTWKFSKTAWIWITWGHFLKVQIPRSCLHLLNLNLLRIKGFKNYWMSTEHVVLFLGHRQSTSIIPFDAVLRAALTDDINPRGFCP